MDALTALHQRNSVNLLTEPAPTQQELDNILKAGLRACDHASLTPWEFLLIEGDAREKFGDLMVAVKTALDGEELNETTANKIRTKPLRAPTILVVVAKITDHPKVPEIEQVLSAGASAQMMMTAAHAQGIGAIWRSGALMFHEKMREGLGLQPKDQIIGFLYMGKPKIVKPLPMLNPKEYTTVWQPS